jgi:hypothetical protein
VARRKERPPVERVGDGFALNLGQPERDLLARLLDELRTLLMGDGDLDALRRVFPPAYHLPDDAPADAEYQRLMREELVVSRLTGIATVEAALSADGPFDEVHLLALMQAINGLRLVLGTILDVDEHTDVDDLELDHPQLAEHHLYGYLSWLLDWTVRALSSDG